MTLTLITSAAFLSFSIVLSDFSTLSVISSLVRSSCLCWNTNPGVFFWIWLTLKEQNNGWVELPACDTFPLPLPQCRGLCAHPSDTAGRWTADRCGSKSPEVCRDGCRCCLWSVQRPPSVCVFSEAPLHSEASGESHSKRPNTPDRTWKLFFFSPCRRHTAHHQVQHTCHQLQHFVCFPPCVPRSGQPEVCSSSEQASGRKSACTEGSWTSFPCRYYYPRRRWHISYSNCVHRWSSLDPPVTVNRWSSRRVPDSQPFSPAQTDKASFIFSAGGACCPSNTWLCCVCVFVCQGENREGEGGRRSHLYMWCPCYFFMTLYYEEEEEGEFSCSIKSKLKIIKFGDTIFFWTGREEIKSCNKKQK